MFMASFEGKTCPFYDEATKYELMTNKHVNKTIGQHESTAKEFLKKRLNISMDLTAEWVKRIIDELQTNVFE